MGRVNVNGHDLHYVRRGTGEPLLLIQGMSGNHLHWGEPFLARLEGDFDLIAYDHRGIGHSSAVHEPFTLADLADDAAGLLAALDVADAHVVGISMGGMVGQELALRHPERVRTLTLGATYAGGENSALTDPATVQALTEALLSGDRDRAIRAGWEVNVSERYGADPEAFAAFAAVAEQLPAALPILMQQMQAIAGHDTSARLERIAVPTLVVHGTEDRMLPVANAHAIAARVPGARLELLDGVGHLFFWEAPERSAELVRELAGVVRAPASAQDPSR